MGEHHYVTANVKTTELRFPALGLRRRDSAVQETDKGPQYASPWACNVRLLDPIHRRLRGGSRTGLTKLVATNIGTDVIDMVSVNTSSTSGAQERLVIIGQSGALLLENGTPLLNESGGFVHLESFVLTTIALTIVVDTNGFLVVDDQYAYAIASTGIIQIDPKTGATATVVASAGTIPTGYTFGVMYRARLLLSGFDNAIYASAVGDYTDWDLSKDISDTTRAFPFQLSLAGEVGPLPTALIAVEDKVLLAASHTTLWRVQGDLPAGGTLTRISKSVGIVASRAWCMVDDGIVFLAEDGIYQIGKDGGGLKQLSDERIPESLRDIDTSTTQVLMGYDHTHRAIHIYLRTSGTNDIHWLFELDTGGFWPMQFTTDDHSPKAVCRYSGDLLLAGADGYLRKCTGSTDDGVNIESHVLIGPIPLGQTNHNGRVLQIHGNVAASSADVTWSLVTGDTAEEAAANGKAAIEAAQAGTSYTSYVKASGTWGAGRAHVAYPRTRAIWAVLWLSGSGQWAYESASMDAIASGKWR